LARSRCPFLMFGPVVSGKYCHRPVFFSLRCLNKFTEVGVMNLIAFFLSLN